MADSLQLQEALAADGVRAVNFFNGRLLAGRDMSRLHEARRVADARLGTALGEGVAYGLDVAEPAEVGGVPVVTITGGLAVNRLGQTLFLAEKQRVALARPFRAATEEAGFGYCVPQVSGAYSAGAGVYLLTVAPAVTQEGSAQTNGLDPDNVRCTFDSVVEAVQFRLLMVPQALTGDLAPSDPAYRNRLAYLCFGPRARADLAVNPLLPVPPGESLLEGMARFGLSPTDVPLALIAFERATDLRFIDAWSVRRPLVPAEPPISGMPQLGDPRRVALGTAMFRQFQAQMAQTAPGSLTATGNFAFLPAAGLLPLGTGYDGTAFFKGLTTRGPLHINAAELESLLRDGLTRPPIPTRPPDTTTQGSPPDPHKALVWLYRVAEHAMAAAGGSTPRPYLAFATGHIPPRADARFDLFRFDYANVALVR